MNAAGGHGPICCPSFSEHAVAVLVTLLVLEQHSRLPEASFFVAASAALAVLGLGIAFCVRLANVMTRTIATTTMRRRRFANWIVLPAAVILMATSSATHWPATIRFYFSRSSFEELVAEAYAGQQPRGFPRRVGLYWIEYVQDDAFDYESREGRIGFVTGVALVDECGLYYDETNRPSSHYLTTRIAPRWYVTEW